MKTCLLLVAAVLTSGCAQWQEDRNAKLVSKKRDAAIAMGYEPARQVPQFGTRPNPPAYIPAMPVVVYSEPPQRVRQSPSVVISGGNGTTIAQQMGDTTIVSQIGGVSSGTTIAQQSGDTTVISRFGGYAPIFQPQHRPIYTGGQTPVVYTMPLQQP